MLDWLTGEIDYNKREMSGLDCLNEFTNNQFMRNIDAKKLYSAIMNIDKTIVLNKRYHNYEITWCKTNDNSIIDILAKYKQHNELTIELIKKYGMTPKNNGGYSLLMTATYNHNFELAKYLIENGKNLNLRDKYGWNSLMMATQHSKTGNSLEIIKLLIKNGADLEMREASGCTALLIASSHAHDDSSFEAVELLIKSGAKLDVIDEDGNTSLMCASRHLSNENSIKTVKLLIESGANLDLQNNEGWTALMIASHYPRKNNTFETIKLLVESNANLNLQNNEGKTALTLARDENVYIYLRSVINYRHFIKLYKIREKAFCEMKNCFGVWNIMIGVYNMLKVT